MLRKDPLIHFLVIGGIVFALLSWLDTGPPAGRILITADQVAETTRAAALLQGSPPTEAQLERLIREVVRDEVYYREALDLGLDGDDAVVRQRLIEKMQELALNVVDPVPPEADVEAWFEANAARFRIPELVTFDHVFFSPRERGESVLDDASSALEALRAGAEPASVGDNTPLGSRFEAADDARVRTLFEAELTDAVFSAASGAWIGPFESGFGWHLVRVVERTEARDPAYAEIEARVREAYGEEQLELANEQAFETMLSRFDVVVEWQAGTEPVPWP